MIVKIPKIFNALSREGVLKRLEDLSQKDCLDTLTLVYLVKARKDLGPQKDFYSIHRLIKEKNMNLDTLHSFIKHLEKEGNNGLGLKDIFT